jgi:purine-binding chemotaxis protein CheW
MDEAQSPFLNGNGSHLSTNKEDSTSSREIDSSSSLVAASAAKWAGGIDRAEKKRILRERAKKLGQKRTVEDSDSESLQIIEFRLSHERYGAEVNYIREVYPLKDITAIPCTPPFVLGIMNVRGQVVSVLDIRGFFELPTQPSTEQSKVLIIGKEDMECGILTDEIIGEKRIPLDMIHKDAHLMHGVWEDCIMGVTSDRLIVIGMEKLLSDEKIIVQQEVGNR